MGVLDVEAHLRILSRRLMVDGIAHIPVEVVEEHRDQDEP